MTTLLLLAPVVVNAAILALIWHLLCPTEPEHVHPKGA